MNQKESKRNNKNIISTLLLIIIKQGETRILGKTKQNKKME